MRPVEDPQFLALLVHRGYVTRGQAESLLARMRDDVSLDQLLVEELGWADEQVLRLRRTRAGEVPELPGFEILGSLGSGGTSDVFRARDKASGRVLALKVLNHASTQNAATRSAFIAEARLLERLDHAGLVKGFGVAKSGTTYFTRLEYVEGSTLLELLDGGQVFDEAAALRIILTVAEVLAYLADQKVIHRDVKPGNVMLTHGGAVKLIDLGFAAHSNEARNSADTAVGTVAYLSPEQARGGAAADMRSDIYSLGVTLFHLVVGRLPFESSVDSEILRMQVMQSLSSPELKSRGLSPHLHYFIEKMMAKEVDLRFQSWSELIAEIREQLRGREKLDFDRATDDDRDARRAKPPPRRRRF